MERKIKFICRACRWFDKANGNTYHSVRVTRCKDGATIYGAWSYGYGSQYQQTALTLMAEHKWLPVKYRSTDMRADLNILTYERDNHYPIVWNVTDGLKRDMVANGIA